MSENIYLGANESGKASTSAMLGLARLMRRFPAALGFVEPSLYPKFSMLSIFVTKIISIVQIFRFLRGF
jgi:hypothetical protein